MPLACGCRFARLSSRIGAQGFRVVDEILYKCPDEWRNGSTCCSSRCTRVKKFDPLLCSAVVFCFSNGNISHRVAKRYSTNSRITT